MKTWFSRYCCAALLACSTAVTLHATALFETLPLPKRMPADLPSKGVQALRLQEDRWAALAPGARTVIARETAETLADHDPPVLASTIGQRVAFADTAQSGRLVSEVDDDSPAAREIAALCAEVGRLGL